MDISRQELIDKYEPVRKKIARSGLIVLILAGCCILGILILMGVLMITGENVDSIGMGLVPCMFLGVGLIAAFGFLQRSMNKKIVNNIRKSVYDKYFPTRVENSSIMTLKDILYPGFFESPDRYDISKGMSSSWDGIPFKSAKYDLKRRETHSNGNGGTSTSYVTYASGTMFFFDFEREFGSTVKIIEKGNGSFHNTGLTKVETEFIEFNKKFKIYTSDQTQVFYLLTPQIQEKILSLEKMFKGTFCMAFIGSDLWLAINDSGASVKIPMFKPITEETIIYLETRLATPKLIIDNIGLSKNKFKKDAGIAK